MASRNRRPGAGKPPHNGPPTGPGWGGPAKGPGTSTIPVTGEGNPYSVPGSVHGPKQRRPRHRALREALDDLVDDAELIRTLVSIARNGEYEQSKIVAASKLLEMKYGKDLAAAGAPPSPSDMTEEQRVARIAELMRQLGEAPLIEGKVVADD